MFARFSYTDHRAPAYPLHRSTPVAFRELLLVLFAAPLMSAITCTECIGEKCSPALTTCS